MYLDHNRLAGRTVLITGATGNIGRALTRLLLQQGCRVLAVARDTERLEALALEGEVYTFSADLLTQEGISALADWVEQHHPECSVLINNLGMMRRSSFLEPPCDRFDDISTEVAANLVVPLALCSELMPLLKRQRDAIVVNVTSGFAISPLPEVAVHAAAKAGLRNFTKSLRFMCEDAGLNIQVTEVVMTLVENTVMTRHHEDQISAEQAAEELLEGVILNLNEVAIGQVKILQGVARLSQSMADQIMRTRVA